jgi:serine/threonine protein kinase
MRTGTETTLGTVLGSARYMAPEQARGEKISNRVDIYSFGLVLHQMLVGELPARHPIRTKEDTRKLARSLRAIAPVCVDLIRGCLQDAPEDRPTAVECREALRRLADHSSQPRIPWRPVLLVGGIVAAALGLGAWRMGLIVHPASVPAALTPSMTAIPQKQVPLSELSIESNSNIHPSDATPPTVLTQQPAPEAKTPVPQAPGTVAPRPNRRPDKKCDEALAERGILGEAPNEQELKYLKEGCH